MSTMQLRTRLQIRQSILRALGGIIGTATGTQPGDTASLIDTFGLQGGDDEHNGKSLFMTKTAGATATDKTWVTDYAGTTHDATLSPVVSGIVAVGDTYELYPRPFNVDDVNDAIDRAIIDATPKVLINRVAEDNFTQSGLYEYDWLVPYSFGLDFKAVYKLEYVTNKGTEHEIQNCDVVWDEYVDTDVTASLDQSIQREGSGCLKLVVAAGCGAGDILATMDISSLDIFDCDQVEIWIRSSVALSAGDLQLLLDDTPLCASPLESLDIPATSANTWTRHVIDLSDPPSDKAIISVGLKMVVDKGAFTLHSDDIKSSLASSKVFQELTPQHWEITRSDIPKLKLTPSGLSLVGANNQVRISGFCSPDIFADDTTDSEVDPEFITEWALAYLLLYHAKSSQLDIDGRQKLGEIHLSQAEKKKQQMSTIYPANTTFI